MDLNELQDEYITKAGEKVTIEELDEMLVIAIENNYCELQAVINERKGDLSFQNKRYVDAFKFYVKALRLYEAFGHNSRIVRIYWWIGLCAYYKAEYKEALVYYGKAYSCSPVTEVGNMQQSILYNMALCYKKIGDYDRSLEYIDILINYTSRNSPKYIDVIMLKANCIYEKGEFRESFEIYTELIKEDAVSDRRLLSIIYSNLGSIGSKAGMSFEKCEYYLKEALNLARVTEKQKLSSILIEIAELCFKYKKYDDAIRYLEEAAREAEVYRSEEILLDIYVMLLNIYEELKEEDKYNKVYSTVKLIEENCDKEKAELKAVSNMLLIGG